MAVFGVFVEGLKDLHDFEQIKQDVKLTAVQAINETADWGRTRAARDIRDQINFPARYLDPSQKRLWVAKRAQQSDLEARIRARSRATSLARFVEGNPRVNQAGVTVEIAPGKARHLKRAFLVHLRAGSADIDTKSNLGLAVRLRPGESIRNKTEVRKLDRGLYLLYGPSVDQVFQAKDGTGVAQDRHDDIAEHLEDEFARLWELKR